jgi:hypothetical protein
LSIEESCTPDKFDNFRASAFVWVTAALNRVIGPSAFV